MNATTEYDPPMQAEVSRIPESYERAKLRGVLPKDPASGDCALSFELEGKVIRIRMSGDDAVSLIRILGDYDFHSEESKGIPSSPKSVPQEGVKQCPPAASSAAREAEE